MWEWQTFWQLQKQKKGKNLKIQKSEVFYFLFTGHFEEKMLPSAGFIPYAQSLVCSFNNTCHKYEQEYTQFNGYNGSM